MGKRLTVVLISVSLLFSGCAQKFNNTKTEISVNKNNSQKDNLIKGKSTPDTDGVKAQISKDGMAFSIPGWIYELDDDNLVEISGHGINLYKLPEMKPVKKINVDYQISSADISGDILTWVSLKGRTESDIYVYNIKTSKQKQIIDDASSQCNPKIWKNYIVWQDDRNSVDKPYPNEWSLYLYDLNTGKEKLLTKTLAPSSGFNICDNKVVWEDVRNMTGDDVLRGGENVPENNKDIYLYDIETGMETPVATGPFMECKPDVYENYIVWEDRNNGTIAADIVLYNITTKETTHITKDEFDQGTPKIYKNFVVWMDERNGTSTNDVIIDGKLPNSDIFIYDIDSKTECKLTGKGPQMLPSISSKWVAFVLSSQTNPLIQAVQYKE